MTLANQLPMFILAPATMGDTSSHRYLWLVMLVPPMPLDMDEAWMAGQAAFMESPSTLSLSSVLWDDR